MSNITLFNHDKFGQIRTITDEQGEPWFVAADICEALELTNTSMAMSRLDEDERSKFNLGRQGEANIVSESGLYELVFQSRKKEAKDFKAWVKKEVLPSIRKTGAYTPDAKKLPENYLEALEALVEKEKKNIALTEKIAADANKVAFAENVEKTVDNLSIQDYAKILYHEDARIGQNRLFFLLRRKGILDKHNKPYQKYIDNGWFVLKLGTYINKSTDNVVEYTQPRITGKGQLALRTKIIDWLSGENMAVAE